LLDNKISMNRLLVKARQLVLILEQNMDDDDVNSLPTEENGIVRAINNYIELTRCRCENCGKRCHKIK